MKALHLVAGVSALALMPLAASAATEVELRDVAARVVVTPQDRSDVELTVAYGSAQVPKIMLHTEGDKLVADGKLKHAGCNSDGSARVPDIGTVAAADLPVINLKVPMDAKVDAGGATVGQVGVSRTLELSQGGCGKWQVGDVSGDAEINIGGSGDVTAGKAGKVKVNIGGSGNYRATSASGLEGNIGGNGNIVLDRIDGDSEINIGGSGNVTTTAGKIPHLKVNIAGSGNVKHGGEAGDVEVNIVGSGDVRIKTVTGRVSKSIMGSGHIVIGQ
ncbi:MAG TPA: DUF2807 domain-containing protein [Asticcacaulis sp.]|nr:DUF2807 domain-containing protein [Asticcacaulis sp.]